MPLLIRLLILVFAPIALHAAESRIADTRWQLVEIQSMDDTTHLPLDPSRYTLAFEADGSVVIQSDCNRATGSWASQGSKLTIGHLSATGAVCAPGSMDEVYRAQFEWVRSYIMKEGHLFLATMADGSIIEFEPLRLPLAATVLGEDVRTDNAAAMQEIVLTRLFDRYADRHGIDVSDEEIDRYVEYMQREMRATGLTAEDDLTAEEAAQAERMRRDMGRVMIQRWKLNRALYLQYGGRVIFQQLGPEPLDAYRRYLEERQAAADFVIHDQTMVDAFWRYFSDDSMHSFYPPGKEAQAFATPPWESAPQAR